MTLQERFEEKVFYGSPCGCHYWIAGYQEEYGAFWMNGKTERANRSSYMIYKGAISDIIYV
jgi:beta-glucosidase/6-phospho-beta-glucosidase/beta-galactosidase